MYRTLWERSSSSLSAQNVLPVGKNDTEGHGIEEKVCGKAQPEPDAGQPATPEVIEDPEGSRDQDEFQPQGSPWRLQDPAEKRVELKAVGNKPKAHGGVDEVKRLNICVPMARARYNFACTWPSVFEVLIGLGAGVIQQGWEEWLCRVCQRRKERTQPGW